MTPLARLRLGNVRPPFLLLALAAICAVGGTVPESAFAQTQGWIGLRLDIVSQSVVVTDVYRNGPADRGGVRPGDMVVAVAGTPLADPSGWTRAVSGLTPSQALQLTVVRDGGERALTIVAGLRPPSMDADLAAERFARARSRLFHAMDSLLRVLSNGEAELGGRAGPGEVGASVSGAALGLQARSPRVRWSPFVFGGARARNLSAELGRYFGVHTGVLVTDVLASTPAAFAGFLPGDVIVSLADRELQTLTELRTALSDSPVPYELTVIRRGARVLVRYPPEQ